MGAGVFIWMRDFLSKHLEYWEVFVGGAFVLVTAAYLVSSTFAWNHPFDQNGSV